MILALRQRHRRIFAALALLIPVAFAAGIAARRSVPQLDAWPAELSARTQTFTATDYERNDLFAKSSVKVRLWRDLSTGQSAVGFAAPKQFLKPDVIAYWVAGRPTVTDELPADAILLGSYVANPLALPVEAGTMEGVLVLFSLADQEILDVSKPVRFNDSTK